MRTLGSLGNIKISDLVGGRWYSLSIDNRDLSGLIGDHQIWYFKFDSICGNIINSKECYSFNNDGSVYYSGVHEYGHGLCTLNQVVPNSIRSISYRNVMRKVGEI